METSLMTFFGYPQIIAYLCIAYALHCFIEIQYIHIHTTKCGSSNSADNNDGNNDNEVNDNDDNYNHKDDYY